LRRYANSGVTVAKFCASEGVSVPSFYHWRKKLSVEPSSGDKLRASAKSPVFRPVTMIAASPALSVQLSHGTRVELATSDLNVIRAVVAELVRADHSLGDGETPC
jgi:hypothetical protein